ncbi:MAG: HDIG domain-containing protein [Clostridia bacterium]|nr:HDIG domain-containing protein [Clostridia bacterium]
MAKEKKAEPGAGKKIANWFRSAHARNTLIICCSYLIIFGLYCLVCAPKQYDLSVGSISRETINATKDVVDEVTTEEKRQAAANAIEPTYRFQEGVKEEVLSSLNGIFSELRTVQQYAQTLLDENGKPQSSYTDAEIEYAQGLVTTVSLSRYQISTLLRTRTEAFEDMVSTVYTAVENSLNTTIREGQLSQSIQTILQIVGFKLDVSLTQNIVPTVLRACLKPNMVIEQETTEIARTAAMDAVEPIVYLQGQNIIRSGDRITRSQLEMLRALGLLKDNKYDFSSYQGAALLVLLAMVGYVMSLRLVAKQSLYDSRKLLVVMIVSILGVGVSVLFHLYFSAYFVPMAFAPILLSVLLGSRTGYASVAPMAILISGLAAGNNSTYLYEMILLLIMSLSGGICSVRFMKAHPQRIRVLLAGLISAVVNGVTILAIRWMTSTETVDLLSTELYAMGGGLLSSVLAASLQPVFEALFHLPTPSKLLELCNPNQPLLRRLQIEAPGTYHHSLIVANLAEAAAERVDANPYLARAAGYYHDIGKLKRPQYFKENQIGDNLHNNLDPYVSAAILTSHAKDGYQMALKQRMPQEVANIILQHHGDTPVMFFYHKALQMSNGSPVDIDEFRYEGPRPNTREAAIVMLADTIEAAVRSMPDPTPKAIDQFIERLVRGKLEDGQLSDSPLTLRDIDEICAAFSSVLRGVFHERIEYPEVKHRIPVQPVASEKAEEKTVEKPVEAAEKLTEKAEERPAEKPAEAEIAGADSSEAGKDATAHEA